MKEKFTTIDLFAVLRELRERLLGMRVANVYDIDQKTYLIKLAKPDLKVMLLFESGVRMHTTEFEWPKSLQPSGFAMKLRKHLRTRRLTELTQLGVDRVVDMQFGSNEAAYHLIVELYDRGNVILTDHTHMILSLLRTRTDADSDVRFANREVFSTETIKMEQPSPTLDGLRGILSAAKPGDSLKHILNPHFVYGSALLTHCLLGAGLKDSVKIGAGMDLEKDLPQVMSALEEADHLFQSIRDKPGKGYLIQKEEKRPQVESATASEEDHIITNVEFHPLLFRQHESLPHKEVDTFDRAVDEFFSSKSGQKQDLKAIQVQKTAVKKLDNVRKDHERRIDALQKSQSENEYKAQLIEMNLDLVERASLVIRSAVANAMDWGDIELLVKDYQARGDPVAMAIQGLKLKSNEITLLLRDPSEDWDSDSDEEVKGPKQKAKKKGTKVDIDLGLSAYGNATRMYGHKKQAAKKEQKTVDASAKALKSAEKKTKQTLKEAAAVAKILKARKVHWFEKFFWFISSENYLVIGGRDQQQNELLVKKYLKDGDLYVHADIHGATSVIIKNPAGSPVPPKTLNEAGHMAVCYSSAWEARIIISAWWVYHHQVSKTAPTGEYLTTGSFMIRGKKNFLPPCQLVLGFGFLFRVDDSCIANHLNERKVKADDELSVLSEAVSEVSIEEEILDEEIEEGSKEGDDDGGTKNSDEDGGTKEDMEESDEADFPWPDTTISVAHVSGDKYQLQRGVSTSSSHHGEPDPLDGAAQRQDSQDQDDGKRHQHLSAKQRREMKKQRSRNDKSEPAPQASAGSKSSQRSKSKGQAPPTEPPVQSKRGQKSKQKKIHDKYADQDEEDREMMMKILASSGPQKPQKTKKSGKGKKAFNEPTNPKSKYRQKDRGHAPVVEQPHRQVAPLLLAVDEELTVEEVHTSTEPQTVDVPHPTQVSGAVDTNESLATDDSVPSESIDGLPQSDQPVSIEAVSENLAKEDTDLHVTEEVEGGMLQDDGGQESDEEEKRAILAEENILTLEEAEKEQLSDLDSLTGCPLLEDVLLYAIPVCAPYSSLHNYKFKVKLVPGSNRRGKAAKTAVHRFTQYKECTQIERDLLKSVKDNDLSRYIPGKVKMSLPQSTGKKQR